MQPNAFQQVLQLFGQQPLVSPLPQQPSQGFNIGGIMQGIGKGLGDAVDGLVNGQTFSSGIIRQPSHEVIRVGNSAPVQNSQPQVMGAAMSAGQQVPAFKFQMGQQDYSSLAPQLHQMFQGEPLDQYVPNFIQSANQHGVDPRVVAMIGQIESSGGKNYPQPTNPMYSQVPNMQDTYNPFGYLVNPTTGHGVEDVYNGARNAGFTSIPMAIEALTNRFQKQPTAGYQQFYQNPTIENLQAAYNANPQERDNYLKVAQRLSQYFK